MAVPQSPWGLRGSTFFSLGPLSHKGLLGFFWGPTHPCILVSICSKRPTRTPVTVRWKRTHRACARICHLLPSPWEGCIWPRVRLGGCRHGGRAGWSAGHMIRNIGTTWSQLPTCPHHPPRALGLKAGHRATEKVRERETKGEKRERERLPLRGRMLILTRSTQTGHSTPTQGAPPADTTAQKRKRRSGQLEGALSAHWLRSPRGAAGHG